MPYKLLSQFYKRFCVTGLCILIYCAYTSHESVSQIETDNNDWSLFINLEKNLTQFQKDQKQKNCTL